MLRVLSTVLGALFIAACDGGSDADSPRARFVADAGADQVVDEGSLVQLAGSSTNNDGAVTFFWEQVSGPDVTLSSATAANPSFTAPLVAIGTNTSIELRLSGTDAAGRVAADDVRMTVTSSDWLVYTQSGTDAGLYVFDAETRVTRKLADSVISNPRIAPDGSRIAYIDHEFDIWTVRPDGNGRAKIGNSRAYRGSVVYPYTVTVSTTDSVDWSPDGAHLMYRADRDLNNVSEYFLARADGSSELQLEGARGTFEWSPDGSRVAFAMIRPGEYPFQLYSVRPDGTGLAKLSDAPIDGSVGGLSWSPDGISVAYSVTVPAANPPSFRNYALFTVRADGTERMRALQSASSVGGVWLPTGSLLVGGDLGGTGESELFTMQADGSALTKINGPFPKPGSISLSGWSPDGSRICYVVYESTSGSSRPAHLYTVRPDGTGRVRLNDAPGAIGCSWTSDGSRIVYRGPLASGGVNELFSVRPDGTERARLNADLPPGGLLHYWFASPVSTHVVYIGEQETDNVSETFVVRVDGTSRVKVNGLLGPGRYVDGNTVRWSPDGSRFIYAEVEYDASGHSMWEYFSVLPDGTRVRLHSPTSQYFAQWSPDGSRLLYWVLEPSTGLSVGISRPDGTEPVPIKDFGHGLGSVPSFQWAP